MTEMKTDYSEPTEFFQKWRLHSLGKLFHIRDEIIMNYSYFGFPERKELAVARDHLLRALEVSIEDYIMEIGK